MSIGNFLFFVANENIIFDVGGIVLLCVCGVLSMMLAPRTTTPASQPTLPDATLAPVATVAGAISKTTFAGTWPFSVESGVLQCNDQRHVLFVADGNTYAINGTARDAMKAGAAYKDVNEIWLDNPQSAGAKISIQPVIDAGLALCK